MKSCPTARPLGRVRLLCRRVPHPDPLTEARLQRIISLWEALRRQVDLSRKHAEEIGKLGGEYRDLVRTGLTGLAIDMERRIKSSSARPADYETSRL